MTDETDGQQAAPADAQSAEAAQVETPSEATTEQPTGAETPEEPDAGADAESPKKVPWFQKRINEVTADKYEALRRADYLQGQLDALGQGRPQHAPQQADNQPKEEDFGGDYDAYMRALGRYEARQEILAEREQQDRARAAQTFQDRVEKVRDKLPDYDLYVGDPTLPISTLMAEVIRESEVGPEVAYHLGKNRSEAQRIFGLPPRQQAAELGRLEARLTIQAEAPRSPKPIPPAPPQTVAGLSAGLTKSPEEMTMPEYKAWREADKS